MGQLLYRASKHDCDACELKPRCCPKMPARKVPRSIHGNARDVARDMPTSLEGFLGNDRFWRKADIRETPTSVKCHFRTHALRQSTLRDHLVGMRGKCYASAPRKPAQRRRCRKAVPTLQIEARGDLPRSQQRLPLAGELELSCGRGAPYGVTHTHFAIVSGSALASKSPPCGEPKNPPRSHERLEFDY